MDYVIAREEKQGAKFNPAMPVCEDCKLCGKTRCWTRYADGETRIAPSAA